MKVSERSEVKNVVSCEFCRIGLLISSVVSGIDCLCSTFVFSEESICVPGLLLPDATERLTCNYGITWDNYGKEFHRKQVRFSLPTKHLLSNYVQKENLP